MNFVGYCWVCNWSNISNKVIVISYKFKAIEKDLTPSTYCLFTDEVQYLTPSIQFHNRDSIRRQQLKFTCIIEFIPDNRNYSVVHRHNLLI